MGEILTGTFHCHADLDNCVQLFSEKVVDAFLYVIDPIMERMVGSVFDGPICRCYDNVSSNNYVNLGSSTLNAFSKCTKTQPAEPIWV